jgi:hypothetical protein
VISEFGIEEISNISRGAMFDEEELAKRRKKRT